MPHNWRQNLRFDAWWSRAHKNSVVEGHESGKGRMVPLDAVPYNAVCPSTLWLFWCKKIRLQGVFRRKPHHARLGKARVHLDIGTKIVLVA